MCSDYEREWSNSTTIESAPLGAGVIQALWLLALALVFKMIITVFTFGIKVST